MPTGDRKGIFSHNWARVKQHSLDNRDLPVLQNDLGYFPSCFYLRIQFQHLWISKRIYLIAVWLIRPSANFRQSSAYFSPILCEPCSQKSRFFLLRRNSPPYTRGLLEYNSSGFGCLGPNPAGATTQAWRPRYLSLNPVRNQKHREIVSRWKTLVLKCMWQTFFYLLD